MSSNRCLFLSVFMIIFVINFYNKIVFSSDSDIEIENIHPLNHFNRNVKNVDEEKLEGENILITIPEKLNKEALQSSSLDSKQTRGKSFNYLKRIRKDVNTCYAKADCKGLFENFDRFETLTFSEESWMNLAQQFNAIKWSSQQTWKQALGGHLFFSADLIYSYINNPYSQHFLERSDILWGKVLAASFHHPLALFYLGDSLLKMNRIEENKKALRFTKKILEKAYNGLKQHPENPDVIFALCYGYLNDYRMHQYANIEDINLFDKWEDLRINFIILKFKQKMRRIYPSPTLEDYLALGQQGFLPAYQAAADLSESQNNIESQVTILEKMTLYQDPYAYIKLAKIDLPRREKWIQEGMNLNISHSYILKGLSLIGDVTQETIEDTKLLSISPHLIEEATNLFEQAGKLHNPKGFECLGLLKFKLGQLQENQDLSKNLYVEALKAFAKGCKLGSAHCYSGVLNISKKTYDSFCQVIGPDPDVDLWASFQSFLERIISF